MAGADTVRSGQGKPLSLGWLTLPKANSVQLVEAAGAAGFSAVSIRLEGRDRERESALCEDAQAIRLLELALADHDVRLGHMGGLWLDGHKPVSEFERAIECGVRLGTHLCAAIAPPDRPQQAIQEDFNSLCELASRYQVRVAMEFGAYLGVPSLDAAVQLVERSAAANAGLLVDALHLHRSGSRPDALRLVPPERIYVVQLCDAKAETPAFWQLQTEARGDRLDPGQGVIPLCDLLEVTPSHALLEIEAPCFAYRSLHALDRARLAMHATQGLLQRCAAH